MFLKAQYIPLPEGYSEHLKHLLNILLQINPKDRPSAKELNNFHIPNILSNLGKFEGYSYENKNQVYDEDDDSSSIVFGPSATREYLEASTATMNELILTERSILYVMKNFDSNFSLDPIQLPSTCKIKDVSISDSHFLVVAYDGSVYAWGDGHKGQLGQSNGESTWKHFPSKIETLQRQHIVSACAGDGFSIFLNNYGIVMSCGTSNEGCLGIHNITSQIIPRSIEKFGDIKIVQISCFKTHVMTLDIYGNVYSFGSNEYGALGLGELKMKSETPQRISLASSIRDIKRIFCAFDCSIILTHDGIVYACGSNNYNRFGFGKNIDAVAEFVSSFTFLSKKILEIFVFSLEKSLVYQKESHRP